MTDDFREYREPDTREPAIQIAGRFLGIVVFLGGIAMLAMIFSVAYHAFLKPDVIIATKDLTRVPPVPIMALAVPAVLKLMMLFVMGYIGSLIAARGAQMFFSAKREVRRGSAGG